MRLKRLIRAVLLSLKANGFWKTCRKILIKVIKKIKGKRILPYTVSQKERQRQSSYTFKANIKFSILVPLYNTPEQFLIQLITSVKSQTYTCWELCLADGSDEAHAYVGKLCMKASETDNRILYKKLDGNLGISGNTNCCIEMSTGDYLGLLDHDDILHPAALFDVMKAIDEKNADFIYTDENTFKKKPKDAYCPNFKPDFSPDMLRSLNYICHFTVFSRQLLEKVGMFRSRFNGSQDYDMILRLTEVAQTIVHIPKVLYYWRASGSSVAADVSAKPYTIEAAKAALAQHLERVGLIGAVEDSRVPSTYRIRYKILGKPLISIMIPNKDHVADLKKCIDSILGLTSYKNYEILIIENNSTEAETLAYYEELQGYDNIQVVKWGGRFNFSGINNFGFQYTHGDYLVLLNNDITVITPDWLQEMLMFAQRKDVGAAGAMLYYPDDTIQHAGVIVGLGGVAGHSHKDFKRGEVGFMYRAAIVQNLSAVTAACMMLSRQVYKDMGGLDESLEVAFNDVDLCMRIRKAGYLIVFTPYAELYHYESKSRGLEDTMVKKKRFENEVLLFRDRWATELDTGDPYYNPNLTLDSEDFAIR